MFISNALSFYFQLLIIHNFSYAGEGFMRYLLSATLVGRMPSGSGFSVSVQAGTLTPSLLSTSAAPVEAYYHGNA